MLRFKVTFERLSSIQEKESKFKSDMEKLATSFELALTELKGKLAVKSALAKGCEKEVQELTHKLDALGKAHKDLLEVSARLKEQHAFTDGQTLALQAQHELAMAQLRKELQQQQQEARALKDAKTLQAVQLQVWLFDVQSIICLPHFQPFKDVAGSCAPFTFWT
jgi:hypothetical protein